MDRLHCPNNIKVHFAGGEAQNQFIAVEQLGVRYGLYTCYPFVSKKVFGKTDAPIMPQRWMKNPAYDIPQYIIGNMNHTIQDSGLFTLMFGSKAGNKSSDIIYKWYDGLVEYTLENAKGATCVEVDCQKVLSPAVAWELRNKLKQDLPNNRIINVFHLEDGQKGLDRLIEYSDYIAISVPELRFAKKKDYTHTIATYIKNKKPSIDIHLLGCTEARLLKQNSFCTSADSTSYLGPKKFGYIRGLHVKNLNSEKVMSLVTKSQYEAIREYNNEANTNTLITSIEYLKRRYEIASGDQDYYEKL